MRKFLKRNFVDKEVADSLAVADAKLAKAIKDNLSISCMFGDETLPMFRALKSNLQSLLE